MKNYSKILLTVFTLSFLSLNTLNAQKYITNETEVSFFSSTPIENIEAYNNDLLGVIDAETNEFAFRIPIKSFIFDKALMQEHFNENYLESDKYPNASFKGKIDGIYDLRTDGAYALEAIGSFDIHGITKEVSIPATINVENGVPAIQCNFKVALVDYDIEIPKIVFYNIAETIDVKVDADFKLKE